MLAAAGLGVAVAHAPDSVRAVADRVIADNNGDALAAALDDIFA